MATGNKPVKGRTNKRKSKVGKRLEHRGGARPRSGPAKNRRSTRKPAAKKDIRKDARTEFLDLLGVQSKKTGEHRLQVFVDILHDKKWEKFRSTNAGGKAVSQLIDVVFVNQSPGGRAPGPGIPLPTGEDGEDDELTGPPDLPELKPVTGSKMKVA